MNQCSLSWVLWTSTELSFDSYTSCHHNGKHWYGIGLWIFSSLCLFFLFSRKDTLSVGRSLHLWLNFFPLVLGGNKTTSVLAEEPGMRGGRGRVA